MCYTVSIFAKTHIIEEAVGATFDDPASYQSYINVTGYAHPFLPFVTNSRPVALQMMSWGLIPRWARTEQAASDIREKTLNARIETIFERPSFRQAAMQRTGLLPVQGFIEWRHEYKAKHPFLVRHHTAGIMTLGCLWDEWVNPRTGEVVPSFTIVTTPANTLMRWVHNSRGRMPLIIEPEQRAWWLGGITEDDAERLRCPFPDGVLEAVKLKQEVSKVRVNVDDMTLHEMIGEPILEAPRNSGFIGL